MKKISLLIVVSVFASIGFAQQFPLQSQYQFNYPTINPAASGENDFYRARASFREQWVGLTKTPISTQILTVTKGFGNNGLGITVFSDKTGGAFSKSGGSLSYSHRVQLNTSKLAFGVSAGASKINLSATNDPVQLNTDDVIPEFTFGMLYTLGNLKVGISVPGLLNANMDFTDSDENTLDRHFYSMISYDQKLNDDWSAHPSILVKTTSNNNQIDANINFKLKNRFWLGTSYRQDFGPTIYVGIDFGKLLSVYSFDISTNEVADYSNGSHEFTLGYDFITDSEADKKIIEIEEKVEEKILNDKDKDGIDDYMDLCPDQYGEAIANGCPDSDKDGVPDQYDLCPYLFGDVNNQGCPKLSSNESEIITMALEDLRFDFDQSIIKNESFGSLINLVVLLHKNSKMMLFIDGYASSEGGLMHNLNLSAQRAKEVQQFFIKRGIDKGRLIIDFYGEEAPLNSNSTEQERAANRRVHFEIKYHLVDKLSASELKNEYDSLLNIIYNRDTINIPSQKVEVFEEKEKILDISNDSTPAIKTDTLIIIEEVPAEKPVEDVKEEEINEEVPAEKPVEDVKEEEINEEVPE
jgi:type IX secretion system PorP/SprF family membrane protein